MPAPLNVDREAVRTLATAIGTNEAARKMNLREGTVRQWSARGKWFAKPAQPPTMQPATVTGVTKPADALANVLLEHKHTTKLGLAKYSADAAQILEQSGGNLKLSRPAKDIADIAGKVWPEQPGQTSGININVLAGSAAFYTE